MKLLKELNESVELITESIAGGGKNYYIQGKFIQSEVENKNKRIYPKGVVKPEVDRYIDEFVKTNRAYGELQHPIDRPNIDFDRVSHLTVELDEQGNDWIGKAVIADTDKGKIVKALMDIGGKFGVSTRGLGSLKSGSNGISTVQNDFKLMTAADIVADPSAPDAIVEAIMEETEWIMDRNGNWVQVMEGYRNQIRNATTKGLQEEKIKVIRDFFSRI